MSGDIQYIILLMGGEEKRGEKGHIMRQEKGDRNERKERRQE